jgi:hypothetical protein
MNEQHFEETHRRVRESEDLVAGWRELISRMQADGRDVTVARDILKAFEHDLEERKGKSGTA